MRGPKALLPLAALAAACSNGGTGVVANLQAPRAVVAFNGMSNVHPGQVVPLLAVTATQANVLRIVDPESDEAVRGPAVYGPLSVPTLPAPSVLAASSLYDGQADVLLVASGGTVQPPIAEAATPANSATEVQLFATWLDGVDPAEYGILTAYDLGPVVSPATTLPGTGAQIVAMVGVPVPGPAPFGTPPIWPVVPGVARVVVGFSPGPDVAVPGGKLVALDFARNIDGSVSLADAPTVMALDFTPLALAASPDHAHLYVATKDPLGSDAAGNPVFGVAEVDVRDPNAANWTVRALNGLAPTVAVAAGILGERTAASNQDFGPPALRVYAAIDPSACGPTKAIGCGLATYDPALGGLAADPAPPSSPLSVPVPQQPYRAPLYVPYTITTFSTGSGGLSAFPLVVAVAQPAQSGSAQCSSPADCPPGVNEQGVPQPLGALQSVPWTQWTSAVGAVGAGDGSVYVEDLGRFGPPDNILLLDSSLSRTQVLSAVSTPAVTSLSGPFLGLYDPPGIDAAPDPTATIVVDSADLVNSIIVWPGFTPNDTFTLTQQGILPGLGPVQGVLGQNSSGFYLAIQQSALTPLGSAAITTSVVTVGSPELGIHPADAYPGEGGDVTQFYLDQDPTLPPIAGPSTSACITPAVPGEPVELYEATIGSLLPPDPVNYPGGALLLTPANPQAACLFAYLASNPGSLPLTANLNVRASGLVLTSTSLGYAGRPVLDTAQNQSPRFSLAWQVEDGLTGEALVLARKGRRLFYPGGPYFGSVYQGDPCPNGTACYPGFPEMTDPMQPGPVVSFRPAISCAPNPCPVPPPPLLRGTSITFQTTSGMTALAAKPADASIPTSAVPFDKSVFLDSTSQSLGWSFYVTYTGSVLFVETPESYGSARTIR